MYYQIFLSKIGSDNLLGRYKTENLVLKDEIISLVDNTRLRNGPITKEDLFYKVKKIKRTISPDKGTIGPFYRDSDEISLIVEKLTIGEIKEIAMLDH